MNATELSDQIKKKKSYLCVGLDSDPDKLPEHLKSKENAQFLFNKAIIDNTHDLCVAYKINTAFYEVNGSKGWEMLKKTAEYIKSNYPEIFLIADAKRGDIGNTARMYAKAFFEQMSFDALTVAPYMGKDSVEPFFEFPDKWVIILGLTSNKGAEDFQFFYSEREQKPLFEKIISHSSRWGNSDNTMYVFGATRTTHLKKIRELIPDHFLLVPGIGAQGGSLYEVSEYGMNAQCGLLVNSSRSVIFADSSENYGSEARKKAKAMQNSMKSMLKKHAVI
jgi:orotidine-5'-phosphate decarboxylase